MYGSVWFRGNTWKILMYVDAPGLSIKQLRLPYNVTSTYSVNEYYKHFNIYNLPKTVISWLQLGRRAIHLLIELESDKILYVLIPNITISNNNTILQLYVSLHLKSFIFSACS